MATAQSISEEVKLLLDQKGKICVSIILPLHNLTVNQQPDKIHLEKTVKGICERLKAEFSEQSNQLIDSLKRLHETIEFNRNHKGIGLYISDEVSFYSTFPFTVSEHIVIDVGFRLREVLMKQQYAVPYHVLYMDEKEIRLYTGSTQQLNQISNGEFPMVYEDSYEYQPASKASSYGGYAHVKSFEQDKATIEKIRHEAFIQQADELLHKYIQNSQLLILCGTVRYTSAFLNRTSHADKIFSVVNGNYSRYDENTFGEIVWPLVEVSIHEKMIDSISDYNEKVGEGLAEKGIFNIWEAVNNSRGDTLLVEKNYEVKGFLIDRDSWRLHLEPPPKKHVILNDVVNNIIERLLERNGTVIVTEDGMLNEYQHIALITRYRYLS